jgi:hypothetical protein
LQKLKLMMKWYGTGQESAAPLAATTYTGRARGKTRNGCDRQGALGYFCCMTGGLVGSAKVQAVGG